MRNLRNYLLYSNIFIAICAFCLTMCSSYIFPISKIDLLPFAMFSFFSVFTYYNFQRIFQFELDNYKITSKYSIWLKHNFKFKLGSLVLIIFCCLPFVLELILTNLVWILASGITAVFYFLPIFPMRKILFIKPFFVSFFWVLICILFPLIKLVNFTIYELLVFSVAEFFFIAGLCLLFDIRDMKYDEQAGVKTFPLTYGILATKIITSFLLVFFLILIFCLSYVTDYFRNSTFQQAFVIVFIFSFAATWFANEKRSEYYFAFFVDGCILSQFIVLLGIENFQ